MDDIDMPIDRFDLYGMVARFVDLTLQLCAAPAASARAAGDKARFLFLIADWLARRRPATAALISAARDRELAIWGGEASGTA